MAKSTMKAVVFYGGEKGIKIERIEKPEPQAGDILVRIKGASLCQSDLTVLSAPAGTEMLPLVPGHEAAGIVETVGAGVTAFTVGDKVGFLTYYHPCGQCKACAVAPLACPSTKLQGFNVNGYFAEYCAVDARSAIKLPDGMDVVTAAPLFCAGLTAYHAVDKAELQPGQWIGVVGVGGLGHLAIQYAVKMGLKVIAMDIDDGRLDHAKTLGAASVYNTRDPDIDFVAEIRRLTGGGVDASCVFSGAMAAYDAAIPTITVGGLLMVVGLPEGDVPIPFIPLALGLLRVKGASSGRADEMEKCINFSHEHNITPSVSEFALEQFAETVDSLRTGKFEGGRMLVRF